MIKQEKVALASIGIHCDKLKDCSLTDSLIQTFAELKHAKCAQIFTHGPRSKNLCGFDKVALTELCKTYRIYVHQTYCTSWKPEGLSHIQDQLTMAEQIGARGLVLHLAKISPEAHILVLKSLKLGNCKIILEMRALKSDTWTYQSPTEINALCKAMADANITSEQVIICLDTAHLSAAKIPLKSIQDIQDYMSSLLYPEYIGLLHLNGNEYDPTIRAGDKHCVPLGKKDKVFKNSIATSGILELIDWFLDKDRDVILEQDYNDELREFYTKLHLEL